MNKVSMKEFYNKQAEFLHKHDCTFEQTGTCDNYHKSWISEDGAMMTEINRVISVPVETCVRGIKVTVNVELIETECYSTEWPSMYMYQQC